MFGDQSLFLVGKKKNNTTTSKANEKKQIPHSPHMWMRIFLYG